MKKLFLIIILFSVILHLFVISSLALKKPYSHDSDKKLSQYTIENYRTDHGLPSNILNHIYRTKDGYIWITTYNGLVRFDGTKFTVFNSQNTNLFETDGFSVFAEEENGRLLIGTYGRGVYTYKNSIFAKLGSEKFDEIIESILIEKKGRIWISTRNSGLFIFKDGLYIKMFEGSEKISSNVKTIKQKNDGVIYFGTNKDGVFSYQNGSLFPISENYKLKDKAINSLIFDNDGVLWIGTIRGMYRYDGEKISIIERLKDQYITKIIKDEFNNIWVSAMFGVFRKTNDSEWQSLAIKSKVANFSDLVVDNEGNMWISTYREGLFSLKDSKITSYGASDGVVGGINTILELENNRFLIGNSAGHVYTISSSGVQPYTLKTSFIDNYIMHIFKDSRNNILLSTTKGILKIAPDNSETWLTKDIGLGKIFVRLVFEDSRKNLWIGTNRKGLIKLYTDNRYVIFDSSNGLGGNMIMSLSEDYKNNILVGTAGGGLNIITKKDSIKIFSTKNGFPSDTVFYTYTDKTGTIWITSTDGLIRFKGNSCFVFSKDNGFPANTIYKITEDNDGDFWITSQSEIIRISKKLLNKFVSARNIKLKYKIYDKHSGIIEPEFTTVSSVLIAKNNSLWFTTTNMLLKIEPDKLPFNTISPPVYVESMIADNNKVYINDKIVIKPDTKRLTFNYTALHYFAPAKVRFKYKLEGYENNWIEVGNKRSVSYTNLSYGHYTFRVIASNNDGVWNKKGDKLSFTVKRSWYETLLFRLLVILLVSGLIFLVFKRRVKWLMKRQIELELTVKERTADIVNQKEKIQTQSEEIKASFIEIKEKNKKLSDYITELKVLRGIVPICSSCKKIRDREGHWSHIESYIERHSEAQFSHGICKDCEVKLYGEEQWYQNKGKK